VDSSEDFAEQCRSLIESKQYGLGPAPRRHRPPARRLPEPLPEPPHRRRRLWRRSQS
jgi:hypothetical protein